MNNDNGVYILETNKKDGSGKEYRITHATAIENIYNKNESYNKLNIGDCYKVLLFTDMIEGDNPILSEQEAQNKAFEIYKGIINSNRPACEYGISIISLNEHFPTHISYEEADKSLRLYYKNRETTVLTIT